MYFDGDIMCYLLIQVPVSQKKRKEKEIISAKGTGIMGFVASWWAEGIQRMVHLLTACHGAMGR
jgi:hypothetical protein